MKTRKIAIDGPAGAGKSSIAKEVAKKLGFVYVDTGALYRTVGLYSVQNGISHDDTAGIIATLDKIDIDLAYENGQQCVYLNGEAVGDRIRTEQASLYASAVSKIPEVRAFLLDMQKKIAKKGGVIMDGRDIGTVILPDAKVKIYLSASPEARARRRYDELQQKGDPATYEEVLADMIKRDYDDMHREIAPLKQAEDAIPVDTSGETLEESVAKIKDIVYKKLAE